jgi:hypothetical protein
MGKNQLSCNPKVYAFIADGGSAQSAQLCHGANAYLPLILAILLLHIAIIH